MQNQVIIVCGPTAAGKTKLAIQLARLFNGEIISADSRQVYTGMDIGTGKDLKEYGKVKYHLIDVVSPKSQFTVAQFQKLAAQALHDIWSRGKLPIICGGTGLYIDTLLKGYQLPTQADEKTRQRLDNYSLKQLLALLKRIDFETYTNIDRHNRRRVQRALEIYYQTGKTKSDLIKNPPPTSSPLARGRIKEGVGFEVLKLGLTLPRADLNRRIEQRLQRRLEQGMVAEVTKLRQHGISWKRLDEIGLEYRYVSRFLNGELSRDEMLAQLTRAIEQYAKRQMTWFKRGKEIHWVKNFSEAKLLVRKFLDPKSGLG